MRKKKCRLRVINSKVLLDVCSCLKSQSMWNILPWLPCILKSVHLATCLCFHMRRVPPIEEKMTLWHTCFHLDTHSIFYWSTTKYLQNWAIVCVVGKYQYYSRRRRPDCLRKYSMAKACIAKRILDTLIVAFSSKELILIIMGCGFISIGIETKDW